MTANGTGSGGTSANRNHPVHGYQSLIKDQPAIQSAEITKYLKQNFVAPEKDRKYSPEYVTRKTSTSRVLSLDKEKWRTHFQRRKGHFEKGFFTPSYKSYSSVGYVELNPQQLVLNVFDDCLNKKKPIPAILTGKLPVRTPPCQDIFNKDKRKSPSHFHRSSTGGLDFSDEEVDSAGFSFIKKSLMDSEKVMIANRGGQPYDQCMRDIQAKREQSHEDEQQQCAVTFLPPAPEEHIPLVPTMDIYAVPISTAPDPTRPCSKARAAEEDREREQERMIFNRSKRLMLERLKMIQMILNALHNMKSRDLRSRVPLSTEVVKHLYRDVADKTFVRPVKNEVHYSSNDTVNSNEKASVAGRTSKTVIPSKLSTLGRNDGLVSTTPTPTWRKHRQNIIHHRKELRVETWEDLITLSSPSNVVHRNSVFPNVTNMVGRLLGPHRHGDSQKLPFWQAIGLVNEDTVERPPVTHKGKGASSRKHPDPENTLKSLIQNFTRVKKKMAREVQSDLEKLIRDRHRTFRQKFQCLNKSPLFEKTVQHLKGVSTQPMPMIVEDTNTEIKPSKWFLDLKSGAENIVGKDDKEVCSMLQQLSRFSYEDAKSIPNAKEKLCLLVMSMPASHLLTIPAQQALKYVLDEILWASSESLSQWLNHRKIPLILQEPSSSSFTTH
ncbi:uncharacterized protein [Apostichopus japonicus]|uniref:uncharacterized protein n=1 Tax=Stichopus japonicus TaxID=307972 RepID=UPI003AB2B55C